MFTLPHTVRLAILLVVLATALAVAEPSGHDTHSSDQVVIAALRR
jgi:hypothetical protein